MRKFLMLIVATAIFAGAYVVTYGFPVPVSDVIGAQTSGDATNTRGSLAGAAPETVSERGPPAGGRRGSGRGSEGITVVTEPLELQPYESVLNAIGTASALRSVE